MEVTAGDFLFSSDKQLIDVAAVHHYLSTQSYWAKDIPLALVKRSIDNSICFGVYKKEVQVGFARWITDKSTYAYLCDVYISQDYRGLGLSKQLMTTMLVHPDLQGLRRYHLVTLDAHDLYSQFGFKPIENPERQMAIVQPHLYADKNSRSTD